ncbi:hypothetical protein B0J12DRAFT_448913 [Macrophomina phaseolina]|uniref:Uncharacterized protein n=1 Tax=Macrophomina phaseolina TaxID=35725 RepID=A0ABQ8GI38_9PEZI|nr:hypothetical protein B0J12DRAFT_448913 [Macrophomina phaseolina]
MTRHGATAGRSIYGPSRGAPDHPTARIARALERCVPVPRVHQPARGPAPEMNSPSRRSRVSSVAARRCLDHGPNQGRRMLWVSCWRPARTPARRRVRAPKSENAPRRPRPPHPGWADQVTPVAPQASTVICTGVWAYGEPKGRRRTHDVDACLRASQAAGLRGSHVIDASYRPQPSGNPRHSARCGLRGCAQGGRWPLLPCSAVLPVSLQSV